jgi:hypothetical protein
MMRQAMAPRLAIRTVENMCARHEQDSRTGRGDASQIATGVKSIR